MNIKSTYLIEAILILFSLSSCNTMNEHLDIPKRPEEPGVDLIIKLKGLIPLKSSAHKAILPLDSEIGVFLEEEKGVTYKNDDYDNMKFNVTTKEEDTGLLLLNWESDRKLRIKDSTADLYAYYPYQPGYDDLRKIPLIANGDHQVDYIMALPHKDISENEPVVLLEMIHLLTQVKINVFTDKYSGRKDIQSISITGKNFATEGTVNLDSGVITPIQENDVSDITIKASAVTKNEYGKQLLFLSNIMAVPNQITDSLTVKIKMDNITFLAEVGPLSLKQSTTTELDFIINDVKLTISNIKVSPWVVVTKEEHTIH